MDIDTILAEQEKINEVLEDLYGESIELSNKIQKTIIKIEWTD